MVFTTINPLSIEVSDAVKKEFFDNVKANFDDHESRLVSLAGGSGTIDLINEEIEIGSTASSLLTGCKYVEIVQACIVTEVAIQLFLKAPASTGSLTIDIKKNTTTNPSGFTSILTTLPTFNISTATDYQRTIGAINSSAQSLSVGNIIKLDITSLPIGLQKFRVVVKGTF